MKTNKPRSIPMDKLLALLSTIEPLSEGFKKALKKEIVMLPLPKNHMLLEAAKVAEHAYFLDSGFAMSFRYLQGKKHIEEFYPQGKIVISPRSFFEQIPSKESIQLLEASEVLHIRYDSVMSLLRRYPEADSIYRATMNQYYEESRARIHDFQYLTAVERYEKLHASYPRLEQLVPQEYIASYLGIVPQSLSRIKKSLEDS
jgi:CRP/FNR family transcriptional regulator, anaerobic regulatory protein